VFCEGLSVNGFARMNDQQSSILGAPAAVLDAFVALDDEVRPRLVDGEGRCANRYTSRSIASALNPRLLRR
jgi:hypothetical protein